ncbi:hypothetical protein PHYSODRAFT_335241 [Phytophthora sojae]|uniref:Secreted protein n=1 Tax=Phytophthora sojae (strain P6497) TaxID=1094619 RepID=G4ZUJ3_PHYSP|nr:hypothetical protein PHYSODRAFT_335241 [Phytophthora sojae]EGZ13467.1 hypothetical protein PHYSODRAFT_335241 [Phytophthora sojae]|eukprot:XP_009530896.1 hypothetical protein PHYSODRAFT_335241 [Phytophthora sojae]
MWARRTLRSLSTVSTCRNVGRGHQYCCCGDNVMIDQRMSKLNAWGADARTKIAQQSKQSTATWKIINSHYSTYHHYAKCKMKK